MNALERIARLFRGREAARSKRGRLTAQEVERISAGRDKLCHLLSERCGIDEHVTGQRLDPRVGQMYYKPGPPLRCRL